MPYSDITYAAVAAVLVFVIQKFYNDRSMSKALLFGGAAGASSYVADYFLEHRRLKLSPSVKHFVVAPAIVGGTSALIDLVSMPSHKYLNSFVSGALVEAAVNGAHYGLNKASIGGQISSWIDKARSKAASVASGGRV